MSMSHFKQTDLELQEQFLETSPAESNNPSNVIYKSQEIHILPKDWRQSKLLKIRIIVCFGLFIIMGCADQSIGTLMPFLIEHFETTQTQVSVVFILQFMGYSIAAFANDYLHNKVGRLGVLLTVGGLFMVAFLTISITNVLWLFITVYLLYGLGLGLLDSACNVYLSSLDDPNELMGLLHGFYGIGSVVAPPFISLLLAKLDDYHSYYGLLFALCVVGFGNVAYWFRHETSLKYEFELRGSTHEESNVSIFDLLKDKMMLFFCSYLFLYIGAEISIGSWLLTYLRHIKNLDQIGASYIVSSFWVGLTVGRMFLGFVTRKFKNEYRANLWYSVISWILFTLFTIVVMVYPDDESSITSFKWISKLLTFIMGVFIGPLFPTCSTTLVKILPVHLHVSGVGVVTSLGGTGSAIIPFCVGAIAKVVGFQYLVVLINLVIAGYCLAWAMIPKYSTVDYEF